MGYDLGTLDGIWHSYIPASLSCTYLMTKTHSSVSRLCRAIKRSSVVYVYSPTVKICTSLCRIQVTCKNKINSKNYISVYSNRHNGTRTVSLIRQIGFIQFYFMFLSIVYTIFFQSINWTYQNFEKIRLRWFEWVIALLKWYLLLVIYKVSLLIISL